MKMNVLVINDISWDNFAIVSKRLNPSSIGSEYRINYFYGKHMSYINNICQQNNLHLIRRSLFEENTKKSIEESLKSVRFCIIFHNFIEYNTISSLYIELCNKNNIPYFIVSEHCERFFLNGEYMAESKFKSCVKKINFEYKQIIVEIPPEINFRSAKSCAKKIEDIKNNLRKSYGVLKEKKESRKIIHIV